MARTKRKTNRPRPKVPYRVWVVSWGYRDSDPAATYAFSGDWSKRDVEKRADMLINQWVREEQEVYDDQELDRKVADDTAVYGPFLESYILTVKDMTTGERKEFERDLSFYGESPLLGRSY